MKKLISGLIVLFFCVSLIGCMNEEEKNKILENMSAEYYENGKLAVSVVDKYIDLEIDASEAETKLKTIHERLEKENITTNEERLVYSCILSLYFSFSMTSLNDKNGLFDFNEESDIKDSRNKLASGLGIPER